MLVHWLCKTSVELPTTSIYFSAAMQNEIGPLGSSRHAIWRISPNTFAIPDANRLQILIIRKLDPEARSFLQRHPKASLLYLIDDNVWSGATDRALPHAYRKKLHALARSTVEPLMQQAEHIYTTSLTLQQRIGRQSTLIAPALVEAPAELDHHDERPLKLIFASTRSHLQDLAVIAEPLAKFLKQHPDCQLETFLGHHAPRTLYLSNALHHPPLNWADYRKILRTRQFHIGLAPALQTPFNAARSHNKILEFSCFGAAPVYGQGTSFRYMAAANGAAIISDDFDGDWLALLNAFYQDRSTIRKIANANKQLAIKLGNPHTLHAFWSKELGLRLSLSRLAA